MNRKFLFTDLDGTLLNDKKEIPEENRVAIKKALAKGHLISIATGRSLSAIQNILAALDMDQPGCYAIAYNGGMIYDCYHKKMLRTCGISKTIVQEIFQLAREMNLHCQTYQDTYLVAEKDTPELAYYCSKTGMTHRIVDNAASYLTGNPPKLLAIDLENKEHLEKFRAEIDSHFGEQVDTFFSCKEYLEIVPKGINKGEAIRYLTEHLQVPREDTIGAGDEENDIRMLETTHTSVVMANAPESMHAYATYVTIHNNNEGGVAEAIEKFMLCEN